MHEYAFEEGRGGASYFSSMQYCNMQGTRAVSVRRPSLSGIILSRDSHQVAFFILSTSSQLALEKTLLLPFYRGAHFILSEKDLFHPRLVECVSPRFIARIVPLTEAKNFANRRELWLARGAPPLSLSLDGPETLESWRAFESPAGQTVSQPSPCHSNPIRRARYYYRCERDTYGRPDR